MSSNPKPETLNEILKVMTEIRDILKAVTTERGGDEAQPVMVDPSKGLCPQCQSTQTDVGETGNGHAAYQCRNCSTIWVNDEAAIAQ